MKKLTKLMLAGAAMSLSLAVHAETKQLSVNSAWVYDVENNPTRLDFSRFNNALGSLQSVTIDLHSVANGEAFVENTSSESGGTFNLEAGGILSLNVAELHTLTGVGLVNSQFRLGVFDGETDFGGSSGASKLFGPVHFTDTGTYNDIDTLHAFTGPGMLSARLTDLFITQGGGNVEYAASVNMDAYVTVTYNYEVTAVPEPETYGMLLAGLGLLGVVARKRKSA